VSASHLRILIGAAIAPAAVVVAASPLLADGGAIRVGAACAAPIALVAGWIVHRALLAPLPQLLAAMLVAIVVRVAGIVVIALLLGARGIPHAPALLTAALCLCASLVVDAALAARRLTVEEPHHG
jgi:hypothetical protein